MKKRKQKKALIIIFLVLLISISSYLVLIGEKKEIDSKDKIVVNQKKDLWNLTLVNKTNKLKNVPKIELYDLLNGEKIDKRIYISLQKMFNAARREGIYPVVVSGYRTREQQKDLYNGRIAELKNKGYSSKKAKLEAGLWVAEPGHSEHELGLAIDINADLNYSSNEQVYEWLSKNSYKYGFIYRYPGDKVSITGFSNEPWHYRYVGVNDAKVMFDKNLCLEEYLDYLNNK